MSRGSCYAQRRRAILRAANRTALASDDVWVLDLLEAGVLRIVWHPGRETLERGDQPVVLACDDGRFDRLLRLAKQGPPELFLADRDCQTLQVSFVKTVHLCRVDMPVVNDGDRCLARVVERESFSLGQ